MFSRALNLLCVPTPPATPPASSRNSQYDTMSHRKVDVDSLGLDDEDYESAALNPAGPPPDVLNAVAAERAAHVANLLARGAIAEALTAALTGDAPYGTDPALAPAKEQSTKAVADVLTTARVPDAAQYLPALSPADRDLLLKYVYKAMAQPQLYNCGALLAWHEKITEVSGVGSIVRVMSDRRVI
ncbi:hypothetical protein GGF32_004633 [Allomyces javanicus]|nr:hypothetical protein GGF32_004633 [Allomyces javanicus]